MLKCRFDIQIANCLISSSRYNVSLVAPIFENVGMGKICLQGWCGRDRLMGSSRRQEWHAPWLSCSWHHHWLCHLPCHKVQLLCFACSLALLGFLHWDDCKTVECMHLHLRNEFFFLVRKRKTTLQFCCWCYCWWWWWDVSYSFLTSEVTEMLLLLLQHLGDDEPGHEETFKDAQGSSRWDFPVLSGPKCHEGQWRVSED